MSPQTKDGGFVIDEPEAGIGYNPYEKPRRRRLNKKKVLRSGPQPTKSKT